MGNLQTEFGAKEQFMEPMFPFILVGVSKVKTFIEELVQIDQKKRKPHTTRTQLSLCMYVHVHVHA